LPQPATRILKSADELRRAITFPSVVKTSVGTASRGVWFVRNAIDFGVALQELRAHGVDADGTFADEVLVQEFVTGVTEKAQAVFCRGKLIGFHAYRQIAAGAGGGEAVKESVNRPEMRACLDRIGRRLSWHGALSVDYILGDSDSIPRLIDCNPRLVEPMSAYLAGLDLVALLLRISRGEMPAMAGESRAGVRTHLAMQVLLGIAARGGTRRDLVSECARLITGRGPYAESVEELTPLHVDWLGAAPLAMIVTTLLLSPRLGVTLTRRGWGAHLLDLKSIRLIEHEEIL
jgi:predicted ATP-grasp superfamily ATP-dependent carboligase